MCFNLLGLLCFIFNIFTSVDAIEKNFERFLDNFPLRSNLDNFATFDRIFHWFNDALYFPFVFFYFGRNVFLNEILSYIQSQIIVNWWWWCSRHNLWYRENDWKSLLFRVLCLFCVHLILRNFLPQYKRPLLQVRSKIISCCVASLKL